MNPALSAANEFGFPSSFGPAANSADSTVASVAQSAQGAWYRHPAVALFGAIGLTAYALERTTKPIASVSGKARAGEAEVSAEGSV